MKTKFRVQFWRVDGDLMVVADCYAYSIVKPLETMEEVVSFVDGLSEGITYSAMERKEDGSYERIVL